MTDGRLRKIAAEFRDTVIQLVRFDGFPIPTYSAEDIQASATAVAKEKRPGVVAIVAPEIGLGTLALTAPNGRLLDPLEFRTVVVRITDGLAYVQLLFLEGGASVVGDEIPMNHDRLHARF